MVPHNKQWKRLLNFGRLLILAVACGGTADAVAQSTPMNWPSQTIPMHAANARGNPPVVTALKLHPTKAVVAAAGDDHLVCLWNLQQRTLIQRFSGHTDWVHTLAFSPTGRYLASAGHDCRVIFWDLETGAAVHVFEEPEHPVAKIAWSHDGRWIAGTGFEKRLRIYDVERREMVRELACPCVDMRALAFSPDDRLIAAAGRNGIVRIWNPIDGTLVEQFQPHRQRVRDLVFSPDGRLLVSAGDDRTVHVQSLASSSGFHLPQRPCKVFSLAFFGSDRLAAGGSDNLIRLWDLKTATEIGQLAGHKGSVAALDSSGSLLASGGFDTTVRIWTIGDRIARQPDHSSKDR